MTVRSRPRDPVLASSPSFLLQLQLILPVLSDLRSAFRQFGKSPGLTATILATLALTIGACAVVYSILDQILLRPPDFPQAERIVVLRETLASRLRNSATESRISGTDFVDWQAAAKSFEAIGASTSRKLIYTGGTEPLALGTALISRDLPRVWRDTPAVGRWFSPDEFSPGKDSVAVLGYDFWQTAFGGAADVVGRTVQLDGEPCTVVGVASEKWSRFVAAAPIMRPMAFSGTRNDRNYLCTARRGWRVLNSYARLKPGVTIAQAQAEMDVITRRLAGQYPDSNADQGVRILSVAADRGGNLQATLVTLFAAVLVVLLIGCANVANLLLARATARQREIAVRAALGATRVRLVRQLLAESLLLAFIGGLAGIFVAQWGLELVQSTVRDAAVLQVRIDRGILAFALGLSAATGLLFGLAPAWLASRVDLIEALRQGTRGSTEGGAQGRWRNALIVLQVACALMLVSGAALFGRSLLALTRVAPGLDVQHTTTMRLDLPTSKYGTDPQRLAFLEALLDRVRTIPGVTAAAGASRLPFSGAHTLFNFAIEGRPELQLGRTPAAHPFGVTPEYFRTAGIALQRGRVFTAHDRADTPPVAVINAFLARQYFPTEDPIGHRVRGDAGPWFEIVGIVADTKDDGLDQETRCQIYVPLGQYSVSTTSIIVRSAGDPSALHAALKAQVYALDPNQPVTNLQTLAAQVDATLWRQRLAIRLLGAFSLLALVLAASGIYGVIAYSVSQRTAEIGIRMALGADRNAILRQVLAQGMKLTAAGLGAGLGATVVCGWLIQAQLYQTSPHDPLTLALVAASLALVGLFACWVPAQRATQVDPIVALRSE